MKKRFIIIFLSFLIFLFSFNPIFAQVVINEVQIAPIGERFIELHNAGNSDIGLTGWYIQRKTATGSSFGSLVTSPKFENKSIKGGGYFLISRNSLVDVDIFVDNLTLTQSNILRLRDSKGEDVDQIGWGSLNEGESYQKTQETQGGWTSATPTPGSSNFATNLAVGPLSENLLNNSDNESNNTENTQQQQFPPPVALTSETWPVVPQIFTRIKSVPKVVIVGADVLLKGEVLGLKKEPLLGARYLWTFGDGSTKEGQKVFHNYNYLGKYVVILNTSSGTYSASDRVTVEAIPADIEISAVGMGNDSFVEVHNKTKYELNLSHWKLRAGNQLFELPKNTIILSDSKIIFPSQYTEFEITKRENVELLYPNNTIAFLYTWKPDIQTSTQVKLKPDMVAQPLQTTQTQSVQGRTLDIKNKVAIVTSPSKSKNEKKSEIEIVGENQSANIFVASSDNNNIYKWLFGVTSLVVVSLIGVFSVGGAKSSTSGISKEADEYEIIEDED